MQSKADIIKCLKKAGIVTQDEFGIHATHDFRHRTDAMWDELRENRQTINLILQHLGLWRDNKPRLIDSGSEDA